MCQRFIAKSAPLKNLTDENVDNKKDVLDSEDLEKNQNLTLLKIFNTSHHKK